MRLLKYISICLFFVSSIVVNAQSDADLFPVRPEPAVYVNDFSNWLTSAENNLLEQQLRAMNDTTSTQIIVIIKPDIGDFDRSSYAIEIGNRWGVGQKDKNNGIVMLIVTAGSQRGVFISTGYGLEGTLTDVVSARIARDEMVPYFKEGRNYEGISRGIDAVSAAVHGEYDADSSGEGGPINPWLVIIGIFIIIIILMTIFGKGNNGRMLTGDGTSSGGGFWGGGFGGGFGGGGFGGGSSSGGGGFGGGSFGGGSFGGGGGGASW